MNDVNCVHEIKKAKDCLDKAIREMQQHLDDHRLERFYGCDDDCWCWYASDTLAAIDIAEESGLLR
jgi:hypothetical protein